ncbi:MAG TPA: DUF3108 domain-containing protein [Terriglobales bacterium]|nr:DUF3108 domain-containing protein [Terriglobales bacterium]
MRSQRLGRILFAALLLISAAASSFTQTNDNGDRVSTSSNSSSSGIQPPPPTYQFPYDETYVYAADWRIWTGGTVTITMTPGTVSATADSIGFVSLLYPVHDKFKSIFDPKTYCSQSINKHTEEGFHARDTLITFNYGLRKSVLDETNLKKKETKRVENDIPGCVTDVLTGIYYVGSLPLQSGGSYKFPINDGNKTVEVEAKVEARETVKVPAGTFKTVRVSPVTSGTLNSRGKLWIWYSDDSRRIPVQMRGRFLWGTITFQLQRIDKKQ